MNTDPTNTPDQWAFNADRGPIFRVPGSPDPGVWIGLTAYPAPADAEPVKRILVWHWHRPTGLPARWQGMGVGNHTLVSTEPLHLEASLGCDEGCPNHGWIRDGRWTPA